ncbi:MAG: hypothetical protein ABIS25_06860 [Sphingomicrobium sp.]
MTRRTAIIAGLILAAGISGRAFAHGSTMSHHGGTMVVTGETQIEAVNVSQGLEVYVSEEDIPHEATGLAGSAMIVDRPASRVELLAVDGNRMRAPGLVPVAGDQVIVTVIDQATGLKSFATYKY